MLYAKCNMYTNLPNLPSTLGSIATVSAIAASIRFQNVKKCVHCRPVAFFSGVVVYPILLPPAPKGRGSVCGR